MAKLHLPISSLAGAYLRYFGAFGRACPSKQRTRGSRESRRNTGQASSSSRFHGTVFGTHRFGFGDLFGCFYFTAYAILGSKRPPNAPLVHRSHASKLTRTNANITRFEKFPASLALSRLSRTHQIAGPYPNPAFVVFTM